MTREAQSPERTEGAPTRPRREPGRIHHELRAADGALPELPPAPFAEAPATRHALQLCRLYAPASTPVIFAGQTGTGKSLFARYLHDLSPRSSQPFVDVSAAEFLDDLAADALFGHEPGAFTDAHRRRVGYLTQAGEGTLLIDEADRMSRTTQAKLVRAIEERRYRPLGAERDLPLRCRVLMGFSDLPDALVRAGTLLEDLRYRLGHCIVWQPPLAERREEIEVFAARFLRECPRETAVPPGPVAFSPEAIVALQAAPWRGNLRDLRGKVQAAYLHAQHDTVVRLDHLRALEVDMPRFTPHGDTESNQRAIDWALWKTGHRLGDAARLLGIHRNTMMAWVTRRPLGPPSEAEKRIEPTS